MSVYGMDGMHDDHTMTTYNSYVVVHVLTHLLYAVQNAWHTCQAHLTQGRYD